MNLNSVHLPGTARPRRRRVGRGVGSGLGKTSGKGHKGARARSGWSAKPGYEGGQMPLFRRLPKKGFTNTQFRTRYTIVNVELLNGFEDGARVDLEAILSRGLVSKETDRMKVLGDGEITRKLTVVAAKFSASARAKIEKAGGTVESLETPRFTKPLEPRKAIPSAPKPTRAKSGTGKAGAAKTPKAAKPAAGEGGGAPGGEKAPRPPKGEKPAKGEHGAKPEAGKTEAAKPESAPKPEGGEKAPKPPKPPKAESPEKG